MNLELWLPTAILVGLVSQGIVFAYVFVGDTW